MGKGIIVCGLNGCGKSTLGRALADQLGYAFLDIEDYYFPNKAGNYPYAAARTEAEVGPALLNDLRKTEHFVLASVRGNYLPEIAEHFCLAVYLRVPGEIRAERVRQRSYRKFGARMLPGGDLHEKEEAFFALVGKRTEAPVQSWLAALSCPILEADGTKPIGKNVDFIAKTLQNLQQSPTI